jgi:hemin uptake protein HemP
VGIKVKENKDKQINSKEIFDKEKSVEIKHDGQSYYLKITKANKLILTK